MTHFVEVNLLMSLPVYSSNLEVSVILLIFVFRYVLTLVVDGMRSVRSFNFDKAAASVLTTCVCGYYIPWIWSNGPF